MKTRCLTLSLLWLAMVSGASAGEPGGNYVATSPEQRSVAVELSRVRDRLAKDLKVEPQLIPERVPVRVSEAARLCEIPEAVLMSPLGARGCTAETTSLLLTLAVRHEIQTATRAAGVGQRRWAFGLHGVLNAGADFVACAVKAFSAVAEEIAERERRP